MLKNGSYTKHFYIEGPRRAGSALSESWAMALWNATKAKKAGSEQVNYSGKEKASLERNYPQPEELWRIYK